MKIKLNVMCVGLLAVSVLSLMSCSDQNKSTNSSVWELKPPEFETDLGENSEPTIIKRFDNAANEDDKMTLKPSDRIRFSFDSGATRATLLMKTVCTPNGAAKTAASTVAMTSATPDVFYEKNIRLPLSQKISIYEFLPIEALYQPSGKLDELPCRLRIIAQNGNGSTHDFGAPIRFTLKAQDQTDFLKIESRRSVLSVGHSLGYVRISKGEAYDIPLPSLAPNQNFLLKCEDFQIRTSGKATLADLEQLPEFISATNQNSRDQLCRLFIEERGSIKKMSNFFMLDIYNVDNLVHSVDWSIAYPKFSANNNGFELATVTLFNKTTKVYYARLHSQSVQASVKKVFRNRKSVTTTPYLDAQLSTKDQIVILQPNQNVQVSLNLNLKPLCGFYYIEVKIGKDVPVPVLQLSEQDPRTTQQFRPDVSIPLLRGSDLPAAFRHANSISAPNPNSFCNLIIF